jgi:hypothetical protein
MIPAVAPSVGLHGALWCRECGEPPFHGWVVAAAPSR